VFTRNGAVLTSSTDVADFFEKRHADVLRAVDGIVHSADLRHEWFQEVSTPHPVVQGRFDRSFNLTRDGFVLLAMGFTGEKALAFKVAYIRQFNAVEATLRGQVAPGASAELTEATGRLIVGSKLPAPRYQKKKPIEKQTQVIDAYINRQLEMSKYQ
jgi:Rha family phage regulatory protein